MPPKPADAAEVGKTLNQVHQEAILAETIRKEEFNQRLYTKYTINPYNKVVSLTGKPNAPDPSLDESDMTEDLRNTMDTMRRSELVPRQKFLYPQTVSQEIGWNHKPLVKPHTKGSIFHSPRKNSQITSYMDAAFKLKEQQKLND